MAIQVVNLTDTFDEWRVKDNLTATNFGDLPTLNTTDKTSLVAAVNEINTAAVSHIANVVEDVTPQLGGNLDLNSKDITGTGNITFTGILTATSIAGTTVGTTQAASNNSTKLATTAYVDAQVATEDTLAEMNATTMSGLADLNILQYDSGTSTWKNQTMSAAGIPSSGFAVAMAIALG